MVAHAGSVDKVTLGTFDTDGVSDLEAGKDARNVALLVGLKLNNNEGLGPPNRIWTMANLDEKFEFALIVVAAHRGVATCHELAVDVCGHRDVLANGKAENILGPGKLEAVAVK